MRNFCLQCYTGRFEKFNVVDYLDLTAMLLYTAALPNKTVEKTNSPEIKLHIPEINIKPVTISFLQSFIIYPDK